MVLLRVIVLLVSRLRFVVIVTLVLLVCIGRVCVWLRLVLRRLVWVVLLSMLVLW